MYSRFEHSRVLRLLVVAILTLGLTLPVRAVEYNMDVDADGAVLPASDGLLLMRYLLGIRGTALTAGALGVAATRTASGDVEAYLAAATGPVPALKVFAWSDTPGDKTYTTAAYVMLNGVAAIPTLTTVQRVTASATATVLPTETAEYRIDICAQNRTTLSIVGLTSYKLYQATAGVRLNIAASRSFHLSPGDWNVGICIRSNTVTTLHSTSSNDWNSGWAILTD